MNVGEHVGKRVGISVGQHVDIYSCNVKCRHLLNTAMRAIGGGLHTGEPGDVKIFTRLYSKPFNENFREPILYCVCKNCG